LKLPHRAFHRQIGSFANLTCTPDGRLVNTEEWARCKGEWLPTADDEAFVASLMRPVMEPGKFAGWIAPPARGINGQPIDFEYVRLA
jgi:benzoyl-CoA 2,3-dioxygenase component B